MDPFERIQIGRTGVYVSRLGLGGAPVGGHQSPSGMYKVADYADGVRLVRRAFDLGIRYFDTAPFYGIGRSEVRIGAALAGRRRANFVVSTKAGRVLDLSDPHNLALVGPDGLPSLLPRFDLTRDGIRRSHEESLRRLVMDRVDILYLHDTRPGETEDQAVESALPALLELRAEGTVRAVGAGTSSLSTVTRFIREFDLDVILLPNHYTLLSQAALDELLPLCLARGVSVVIGTPYCSGILASDLSGPQLYLYQQADRPVVERARALQRVCERHGACLKAAALQFVLAHPAVVSVIPGARNAGEVQENVEMVSADVPAAAWAEMKAEGLIPAHAPTPGDGA